MSAILVARGCGGGGSGGGSGQRIAGGQDCQGNSFTYFAGFHKSNKSIIRHGMGPHKLKIFT